MDSNNEYCQRRCFEEIENFKTPKLHPINGGFSGRKTYRLTGMENGIVKRITVTEPNTEGYLKECLSQYEQENLKTK